MHTANTPANLALSASQKHQHGPQTPGHLHHTTGGAAQSITVQRQGCVCVGTQKVMHTHRALQFACDAANCTRAPSQQHTIQTHTQGEWPFLQAQLLLQGCCVAADSQNSTPLSQHPGCCHPHVLSRRTRTRTGRTHRCRLTKSCLGKLLGTRLGNSSFLLLLHWWSAHKVTHTHTGGPRQA